MRQQLAFVVRGPASIDIAITAGRLERWANPFLQRLGRLNIVMPIDQGRRSAWHRRRFGIHQRMPGRGNHFGRKPHVAKLIGHPVGRMVHVVLAVGVGTDARNPQELAQLLLESRSMSVQVLVDLRHGNDPWLES
jgi:hypothetical protein